MEYYDISHILCIPDFLPNADDIRDFVYGIWRKLLCKRGRHLWNEVLGTGGDLAKNGGWEHYLVCDACQLMVFIERVDETYVK